MAMVPARREVSVLVVDDDMDIRDTLAEVLEGQGYSVVRAVNGADALAQLATVRPRLILLDLSMPVMGGEQFRAQQLADAELASIPTVVMTAADRALDRTAPLGVQDTLTKPVKMQRLLDCVAEFCRTAS